MSKKIRVLVVDDSAVIRQLLTDLLTAQPDIEVVGTAFDPFDAREKIKSLSPDVLTLDVEMPKMDGLSFLEKIMTLRPMPVIMVSTLTGKGTETAIAALQKGAVDCLAKPNAQTDEELVLFSAELSGKIRVAATARVHAKRATKTISVRTGNLSIKSQSPKLIAIGASTGGVEALTEVLSHIPPEIPPIIITQHMPPVFTASFAKRLSTFCNIGVQEAADRMPLKPGVALIAPGGMQLEVVRAGSGWTCRVTDKPPVNNHKPSVDVLFDSVADQAGQEALGVILTGMGKDGARGLLNMRNCGAHTIGQDEASSTVYGMPRTAYEIGAVAEVHTLTDIADAIKERCFI